MESTYARSGRRFVFTAISFLLPVRLPLPPGFVVLTTSPSLPTTYTTIVQSRLHTSSSSSAQALSSPSLGDSFTTAAAIQAALSTRYHCGSNVYPLLAAGIESAALEEERAGQEEEQALHQGATFGAVPFSSSGSQLDANEGRPRDATADPSPIDEGSRRAATAPASLADGGRWQRARQTGVARIFGRVFRARSLRRGVARMCSRPPSSTTGSEMNLQGHEVCTGVPGSLSTAVDKDVEVAPARIKDRAENSTAYMHQLSQETSRLQQCLCTRYLVHSSARGGV